MSNTLPVDEALAILEAVDSGDDEIVDGDDWEDVYAGNVAWRTKRGHTVVVFNDCNSWDYVDTVRHADGRECEPYEQIEDGSFVDIPDIDIVGRWWPDNWERWPLPPDDVEQHGAHEADAQDTERMVAIASLRHAYEAEEAAATSELVDMLLRLRAIATSQPESPALFLEIHEWQMRRVAALRDHQQALWEALTKATPPSGDPSAPKEGH